MAARVLSRLSDIAVRTKRRPGYYADGGNLYLRVSTGGTKAWMFRFTLAGKTRDAGLGPYPAVGLAKAREEADRCRRLIAAGIDPIQARSKQRADARAEAVKATTFEQCARSFVAGHEVAWKSRKTAGQWRSMLKVDVYPIIGALPVQAIDTGLVLKVLEPIWSEKPATASLARASIENVLNWAKARGYRTGENPAAWRGHLDHVLPAPAKVRRVQHHSALPYSEMPAFMAKLRARESVAARALEFLVLTASRVGEALGARWDELDLEAKLWTVPPERMKGNEQHTVPLSSRAAAIVREMAEVRLNGFVFPGMKQGRPLSDSGIRKLVGELHEGCRITRHGFRSSFRDWGAEETTFRDFVVEKALAHAIKSKVEAAYRRGDLLEKRRQLMEAWARYCQITASAEVVPLRQRRG